MDRIMPADMLRAAARMSPPSTAPSAQRVAESAFLLSSLIDVEITRLAVNPEERDRMLALVLDHIEQRMGADSLKSGY